MYLRPTFSRFIALLLIVCALLQLGTASAADKLPVSLNWVPADAAFYSSTLRMREQLDILLASRAWAKLQGMPGVSMARQMGLMQLRSASGPMAQVQQWIQQPENQQLIELTKDMFSQETAIYGDAQWSPFAGLMFELMNAQRFGGAWSKLQGALKHEDEEVNQNRLQVRIVLEVLKEHVDDLKVPATVLAFRIKDKQRAEAQIARLETLAQQALESKPEFKGRLQRIKVGKASFLSFSVDGGMLPWDKVDLSRFEDTEGEYAPIIEKLKTLTFNVSLGVRGSFLLVSLGPSSDHLLKLGIGKLLVREKALAPLQQFASERITSVAYTSKAFSEATGMRKEDLDDLAALVPNLLEAADLSEAIRTRMLADLKKFAEELKERVPTLGEMLSLSFLTGHGYEAYTYSRTENLVLDGSTQLDLLRHVGGQPLLAVVAHRKYQPKEYEFIAKWVRTAAKYVDEVAAEKLPEQQLEKYKLVMDNIRPLAARWDEITRKKLIPALAQGEAGLVLDAKVRSKKWHEKMPPADQPLPMLEAAVVMGVSDPKLLAEAVSDYTSSVVHLIRTQTINEKARLKDFELPPVSSKSIGSGTMYWYPLPKQAGLDPQLLPNAGLSKDVAALTFSPDQTQRLLADKPLANSQLIAKTDRPLAAAAYVDFAGLVKAISPWVDYGVREYWRHKPGAEGDESEDADESDDENAEDSGDAEETKTSADASCSSGEDDDAANADDSEDEDKPEAEKKQATKKQPALPPQAQFILSEVQGILEVLQALNTLESVTYVEDGTTVTHSATYFKDLEE